MKTILLVLSLVVLISDFAQGVGEGVDQKMMVNVELAEKKDRLKRQANQPQRLKKTKSSLAPTARHLPKKNSPK